MTYIRKSFALKGGCNLRFFFNSPRYSEDMDLDVRDIPVHVLLTRHRLQHMDADAFQMADAPAVLGLSSQTAAKMLERLAAEGQVSRLKRGLWCFPERMTALRASAYLTAPIPRYIITV